jgi:hypothetical protein
MTIGSTANAAADRPCWICGNRPADDAAQVAVCTACRSILARPYHDAWQRLSRHLRENWRDITARGSFDLSKVFAGHAAADAVNVQLFFVMTLGCRLRAEAIDVDLRSFAAALRAGKPHPEVTLLVANGANPAGRLLSHDSQVSVLRQGADVHSALWTHLTHPVAIKICYIKTGAPVREPAGHPWHPTRQRKIVKLSPYKGDVEPVVARRDLRI